MSLLLGIDLGTSYFKVGLFSTDGTLRGLGRVAVSPDSPAPGRFELSASSFWERLRQGLREALREAQARVEDIVGLSYSSQANTFLLLDGAGQPLTPLVFWHDQRARPVDESLAEFGRASGHGATTGMVGIAPERLSAKCRWFARNDPGVWAKTRWVMTISDYLMFRLTGSRVGDASTAVLTGLYSLPGRTWWPEALAVFGLAAESLSVPLTPGTPCGMTGLQAQEALGLPSGIPCAVGALDHHAAALGSGLGEGADACLSTGTVLAALVLVDQVVPAPGCIHGPHFDDRRLYRLTFDANGARQLEDYQRQQAPDLDIPALLDQAEQAYGGGRGVASPHGAAVLAVLLRIAQAQKRLVDQVNAQGAVRRITATGGGARSPFWLQVTADTLGVPVVAVASPERACLGAAILGSVAGGIWPDLTTAARHMVKPPREFRPRGGA